MLTLPLLRSNAQVNDDVLRLLAAFDVHPADDRLTRVDDALQAADWHNALKWPTRDQLQTRLPEILPYFRKWGFAGREMIGASTGSYAIIPAAMAHLTWTVIETALVNIRSAMSTQPNRVYLLASSVRKLGASEKDFLRGKGVAVGGGDVTEDVMMRLIWDKVVSPCYHRDVRPHCLEVGCAEVVATAEVGPWSAGGNVGFMDTVLALKTQCAPQRFAPGLLSLHSAEPYGARQVLELEFVMGQGYNVNRFEVQRGEKILVAGLLSELAKYLHDLRIFGGHPQSDLAGLAARGAMR